MPEPRPDVVFDCNVLLQAFSRDRGPAAECLRLVEQGRIQLHMSRPILGELRRILNYPEVRQRNPHATDAAISSYLDHLRFRSALHRDVPPRIDYPRDPSDQPYLDLAIESKSDFLVTRDKDLLSLRDEYSPEEKQLRQYLPALRIVNPVELLEVLTHAAG